MSTIFYLSFKTGVCRMSHGKTLVDAQQDCRDAAEATQTECNLLDVSLRVLGVTAYKQGAWRYINLQRAANKVCEKA